MHHFDTSPRRQVKNFAKLPRPLQLLLFTQIMFNVGFYIVVPFLAVFMAEDLAASGALIGIVLGVRTWSQQGMFFVGGALTDRFGVKGVLLTGVAIRVAGFIVAGLSTSVAQLMVGVILIGFAAALFSPAAEAALAGAASKGKLPVTRSQLFALDSLCGRIGALVGPVLGALLIPFGFPVVAFVGAGIFAALFVAHAWVIPPVRTERSENLLEGFGQVMRNRKFLLFAAAYSMTLVAYNQQYLALPAELERAVGSTAALGWMFVYASVINIVLQMPIVHLVGKWSSTRVLAVGFGLQALGFAVVALCAPFEFDGLVALAPALLMLSLLHLGQMVAVPYSRDLVGELAAERNLGTYFGVLNSLGGFAVLVVSFAVGLLLDAAKVPSVAASGAWVLLSVLMAIAGVCACLVARSVPRAESAA